jgi:8-hydroxy-5-deazaflavin:NADPH oxidoreductase
MKIAIIGGGNVGKAIAASSIRAGHSVTISSSDAASASAAAAATGASSAASNAEAVRDADIVVIAVWYGVVDGLLDELGDALNGKVVVDVTNPVKPDLSGLLFEDESAAEKIQARVPNARVVKAFNTVFASRQADPFVDGVALDALIAADDEAAKATVAEFAGSLGFRSLDIGGLELARGLEEFALINMLIQVRTGGSWQGGWKLLEPAA